MKKITVVMIPFLLVFLIACQQQTIKSMPVAKETQEIQEEAQESTTTAVDEEVVSVAEKEETSAKEPPLKEFTMTAKRFEFSPSTIEVDQGDKVRIKITSLDVAHGFSLTAFGISERLEPGKEVTVEFNADRKGEFVFFCSVPCGSGHGAMRGKLVVN